MAAPKTTYFQKIRDNTLSIIPQTKWTKDGPTKNWRVVGTKVTATNSSLKRAIDAVIMEEARLNQAK